MFLAILRYFLVKYRDVYRNFAILPAKISLVKYRNVYSNFAIFLAISLPQFCEISCDNTAKVRPLYIAMFIAVLRYSMY